MGVDCLKGKAREMAHTIILFISDTHALRATLVMQAIILVGITIILRSQHGRGHGKHAARRHARRRASDSDGYSEAARRFEMGRSKLAREGRLADVCWDGRPPWPPAHGVAVGRRP